ncbi:MAG: hypothetical protein AAF970_08735 [Bacteroidota bacterium]
MGQLLDSLTTYLATRRRPHLSQVLRLINQARVVQYQPLLNALPVGRTARSRSCPLSTALGGLVGVDGLCLEDLDQARRIGRVWNVPVTEAQGRFIVRLPHLLERFVQAFDQGAYPALLQPAPSPVSAHYA